MICVIVEISIAPEDVAQFVDDADKVYADVFRALPGFLFGTLAVGTEDRRAVGVVYFESADAWRGASSVIEGIREAVRISPGVTFTTAEYEVVVRTVGSDRVKLLSPIEGTGAPGAPA